MSRNHTLKLTLANRAVAHAWVDKAIENGKGITGKPWTLAIKPPTRSGEQNDRLHAMLDDIADQVEWAGAKRDSEAWKDIFTAALRSANHNLDVVPGINGGFVLLGMHTSSMTVAEMTDLMTLMEAFGAEHGVVFREPDAPTAPQRRAA